MTSHTHPKKPARHVSMQEKHHSRQLLKKTRIRVKQERNISWLLVGVCGISAMGWLIHTFAPTSIYVMLFFMLLAFSSYMISLFVFNNVRRALLTAFGCTMIMVLHMLQLHTPFYITLLFGTVILIEIFALNS